MELYMVLPVTGVFASAIMMSVEPKYKCTTFQRLLSTFFEKLSIHCSDILCSVVKSGGNEIDD